MSITFGNLTALAKTAELPLRFEHRGGAVAYCAAALPGVFDCPGILVLAPVSDNSDDAIKGVIEVSAYCEWQFYWHWPYRIEPVSTLTQYFSQYWENDPVTVLHLAQGTKGALRKRVVTRIEVAFGDDQDVYLKAILSDPLPL